MTAHFGGVPLEDTLPFDDRAGDALLLSHAAVLGAVAVQVLL